MTFALVLVLAFVTGWAAVVVANWLRRRRRPDDPWRALARRDGRAGVRGPP